MRTFGSARSRPWFRLAMQLDSVRHGKAIVLGQGIYLPITASGTARLDYADQPRPR